MGGLFAAVVIGRAPAALAADVENGEAIFNGNCAACHAGGNNSVVPEKKLKKEALIKYGKYSLGLIQQQATNGHASLWREAFPRWTLRTLLKCGKRLSEFSILMSSECCVSFARPYSGLTGPVPTLFEEPFYLIHRWCQVRLTFVSVCDTTLECTEQNSV